ncbi:MAG: DUF2069 domain-containing protein [Rhodocyclaceae bacterium]|nr:DUF2069 domain-containing protein [Rhodocyclaceae bacterium]
MSTVTISRYQFITSASLIALIFLCLGWELWWAPLKPGGSWLVLKAVILLAPLFGILRGKRYTYKWLSLFIQFYLLEGATRATSEHGLAQQLAIAESLLAIIIFIACILFVRATRQPQEEKTTSAS